MIRGWVETWRKSHLHWVIFYCWKHRTIDRKYLAWLLREALGHEDE